LADSDVPLQEGEIWLQGPNVFPGYLNRPELAKDTFSEDGFFKTGDIGIVDTKGNFFITDRLKELIKYSKLPYLHPTSNLACFCRNLLSNIYTPFQQRASKSPQRNSRAFSSATATLRMRA
jgi:hypothetical protein